MKIELDSRAEHMIREALGQKPGLMRLVYDTEDCGCGMSGIPTLQIAEAPGAYDIPVENEHFHFLIDRMQAVFFEEQLLLSGEESGGTFRLDGVSQFYKSNIRLTDHR
ncbi:uncharacterized protein YqkB [Fontibacillus phaseoli]|uniref:Uncharacterized protein YqkB n=1 Tax=Fontibacillus phaseoli TaxID=1416533 RepID=A0A369BPE4_9BACL|nr:iron-sulfur cluster biosynthesis family protein [Fontibacillus phaseoli]RCX23490.1 uncharacterized protein YqkB [Fontibacillus phaseoli]